MNEQPEHDAALPRRRRPGAVGAVLSLWVAIVAAVGVVLGGASPANAQFDAQFGDQFGGGMGGAPQVMVSVHARETIVEPGRIGLIAVVMDHGATLHSWPHDPVLPEGLELAPIPTDFTSLEIAGPAEVARIAWPKPASISVFWVGSEMKLESLKGKAPIYVPFVVSPDAPLGERITVSGTLSFQACDDTQCYMPQEVPFRVEVSVGLNTEANASAPSGVFDAFDAGDWIMTPLDGETEGGEPEGMVSPGGEGAVGNAATPPANNLDPSAVEEPPATAAGPTIFGISMPSPDSAIGMLLLVLASMVGGFVLNLTPCVLPVIPIKVMTISSHAGSPGKSLYLGLFMAAGVVAFWVGIGLPVAFVSGFADPSMLFGIWWVTFGIGLLIAAMGVGIMGAFQIQLPQKVYMVNPKADSPGGSFMFGVMTAVLGLPCFGFVAGALLAGAATMPAALVLSIFGGIGVGMAAPYLVLSAKPKWVDVLPRTGPASDLVKQVMGLLMLAAAVYFLGSGLIALVQEQPWIAKQLHWWAIAIVMILAAVWLTVRTLQITKKPAPTAIFAIIGALPALGLTLYAASVTEQAESEWRKLAAARDNSNSPLVTGVWVDYTPQLAQLAQNAGKVVVYDFTAEWCINCKALKAGVLKAEPVQTATANEDHVLLTVDLTSRAAPGWKLLESHGATGIPLLVIEGPGLDQPWKSNGYTSGQVMAALESAKGVALAPASLDDFAADEAGWFEYTPEIAAAARAAGKTVVIDFIAYWGINNRLLREKVLNEDPIKSAFESDGVVKLSADLTSREAPGWDLLHSYGRTGIPLMVIEVPDAEPWMTSEYKPEEVLAALERARGVAGGTISSGDALARDDR